MQVKDILKHKKRETITTTPRTSIPEAMRLLITNQIGCLLVVEEPGNLIGIISDKDIFRRAYEDPDNFRSATVQDLMTTDLIVSVVDDQIGYIAGIMTNNRIRHIPVVDGKHLVGLVSIGDIAKVQMENVKIENRYLKQYIEGNYPG